MLLLIQKALPY